MKIKNGILERKRIRMLQEIDKGESKYIAELSRNADFSRTGATKLIERFAKAGIVKKIPRNRRKYIELTRKGKKIIKNLEEIIKELKNEWK
ncbi:MAG: hypothetical protein ACOC1X_03750 [Promethearchaeota archaeon]